MGAEIELERRFAAEEAYIAGSQSLEQVARQYGVSTAQIERWSAADGWRAQRMEYRKKFSDIRMSTVRLRRKIIKNALNTLRPLDVFAVSALEKLALASERRQAAPSAESIPAEAVEIKTPADAVAALKAAVEQKLGRMLRHPDAINLAAVKDVKNCLELLDKMQAAATAESAADDKSGRLLDAEQIKSIREQLQL
jgi:hypothetical protein